MMHSAGTDPPQIMQGRVVNINIVNWTVDVNCSFDRKRFFEVQVSSPYVNYNNGEGLSIFPEVGSVCVVCVPGDSSPPFVLAFLMPHQLTNGAAADAPAGTRSHGAPANSATDASFAGNRPKAVPGDIYLTGRDGNFVILRRGGVLQMGSTELAQRICVPLGNLVTDISGTYEHFNSGGATVWGIQEGVNQTTIPSQHLQTFRIFANDKYADIKIASGKVFNPMPEPDGGAALSAAGVGAGSDNPIIFELSVAPKGFVAESGDTADGNTSKSSVLRFLFDRTGNTFLRCEGTLTMQVTKKVTLTLKDDISITGQKSMTVKVQNGMDLNGGSYAHLDGDIVLLGPGAQPVARLGDAVSSFITALPGTLIYNGPKPTMLIPGKPEPFTITIIPPIGGTVTTGQYLVKA